MPLRWKDAQNGLVISSDADFRVNTVSRILATQLNTTPDKILYRMVVEPVPGISINQFVEATASSGSDKPDGVSVFIPLEYTEAELNAENPGAFTLYARQDYINAVNRYRSDDAERLVVELSVGGALGQEDTNFSDAPSDVGQSGNVKVPEGSVVVAVIDIGMAVGHELFRQTESGDPKSRVKFFWNMDGTGNGDDPKSVSVGNAWLEAGLSTALQENTSAGILDDAGFLSQIGAVDWAGKPHTPVAHRLSHGTHVMGLAAGYTEQDPKHLTRPIIAVNLRSDDVGDPEGHQIVDDLNDIFRYILERYKKFEIIGSGKRPPLVVNFSFGNFAGAHDGTGKAARKIRKGLKKLRKENPGCEIVLPAGNGNLNRCHARLSLNASNDPVSLDWRIQPQDNSVSDVEIWLDETGPVAQDHVSLTVQGPGGIPPVTVDCTPGLPAQDLSDLDSKVVGRVHFERAQNNKKRGHFNIHVFATASIAEPAKPYAPFGIWNLALQTGAAGDVGMKAWIRRDETLPGFPEFGRQSRFDDPEYDRFYEPGVDANPRDQRLIGGQLGYDPLNTDALVRRSGTLSGFATGSKTIVVGGFTGSTSRMALYSATGPTNNPDRVGPDASALSDASTVMHGVLSAGSASGSMLPLPGTSVAAPRVARWVADRLADNAPARRQDVAAAAGGMDGDKPPEIRSGGGRMLDLKNPFGELRWPGQQW